MNLGEIKQLVSTLVADSSNNFFTESERLQAINLACNYLNSELRILRNVAYIEMVPEDNGVVDLPLDFVSFGKGVQWVDSNGNSTTLEAVTPVQLMSGLQTTWERDVGTPARYVLEGGNMYITPMPGQAGTLTVSYVAMPNKLLVDTDLPFYGDVRISAYHDLIAYYAAWQLALKDRDFEAAQQFMAYFQARMIDLKENLRHTGGPIQPVWADTYSTA